MATATPVNSTGVALTSTSRSVDGAVSGWTRKRYVASSGSAPATSTKTDVMANVMATASGTSSSGMRGIERRMGGRPDHRPGRPITATASRGRRCLDRSCRHEEPEARRIGRARVRLAHDPALVEHDEAVGQRQKLVEVFGDEQDRRAPGTLGEDLRADVRG